MSSIRKELNELAIKMGAPVVGTNISEQIRALNTHLGGTSHGANISERINEFAKVYGSGQSDVKTIDLTDIGWEQGSIQDVTGTETNSETKIRTTDYIEFDTEYGVDIAISAMSVGDEKFQSCIVCFDENKTDIADLYWLKNNEIATTPKNTKFLRIILKLGNAIITPDDLSRCKMIRFKEESKT